MKIVRNVEKYTFMSVTTAIVAWFMVPIFFWLMLILMLLYL